MDPSFRLSPNFTLGEFTTTQHRRLWQSNFNEALDHIDRLTETAALLQVVRDKFGPIQVNSGFRGDALNKAIGGSKTSQHRFGEAVDFVPLAANMTEVFWWIADNLEFGQVILEGGTPGHPTWIHLSLGQPYRPADKCQQVMSWNTAEGYKFLR